MTRILNQGEALIHFIFTTKYRKPLMADPRIAARCEIYMRYIAEHHGIQIRALAIQEEHLHVMIVMPKRWNKGVSLIAQELKWFSSNRLRRQFPKLRKHKAFWGRRYWHTSIGGSPASVQKYIESHIPGETHA